ncbi:MAG TPA: metal-sulfur cluster assembly factor [Actinomycetota bacterium]
MNEASEQSEVETAPVEGQAGTGEDSAPGAEQRNGHAGLSKEDVLEALKDVLDPELGINIVDLGLVYDVTIEGDTVHITYTLTTMGCPIGPMIEAQMQQLLANVPGVEQVDAEMVLRPPWSPEMMSEEAKAALGYF